MIVTILQAGGLAGGEPSVVARLDTAAMRPEEGEQVERLVADLRRLGADDQPVGTDMEEYRVEVRDAGALQPPIVVRNDYDPGKPGMRAIASLRELGGG